MDSRDREAEFGPWYESFDEKTMRLTVLLVNDEGEDEELTFPAKYEVCGLCDGKGNHVNPSIDSEGISMGEFHDDPDFAESYFGGMYDVQCYRCHGDRVEPTIDEERADKTLLKRLHVYWEDRAAMIREHEAERRMGC